MQFLEVKLRERVFPDSPGVKISPSNTRGEGSIPGQEAASWQKKKKKKKKTP